MTSLKLKKNGISGKDEYDQKVNRAALLEVECAEISARYKLLQQRLKAKAEKLLKEKQKEHKQLMESCAAYAMEHQTEVLKKGTRYGETAQARYGFQLGNPELVPLNSKTTWKHIAAAIAEKGKAFASRFLVFKDPEVNKTALKEATLHGEGRARLTDDDLAQLGCKIVQCDAFYIKPKAESES